MICLVTYLSGGFKVKGYLGIPNGYRMDVSEMEDRIRHFYDSPDLSVTAIADSLKKGSRDMGSDKLPVLIYCRGGIGKVGRVKTHWIEQFANFGYLVFAPCYRGSEGGEGRDEFGGAENEDVLSALRFVQSLAFANRDRITVLGFSRGSINASRTAAEETADIHKLVLWSGISDLALTYEERVDLRRMLKRVIGGSPAKLPESYRSRSPIALADRLECPVLVIHGTEDPQVDFSHGDNMYNKLNQLDANVVMHRYEGYGHLFPPEEHQKALRRMFEWMQTP